MPSKKRGTVSADLVAAVQAFRGSVELRSDPKGVVRLGFARVSFDDGAVRDNLTAVIAAVQAAKPEEKPLSRYIQRVLLATTFGPALPLLIDARTGAIASPS